MPNTNIMCLEIMEIEHDRVKIRMYTADLEGRTTCAALPVWLDVGVHYNTGFDVYKIGWSADKWTEDDDA